MQEFIKGIGDGVEAISRLVDNGEYDVVKNDLVVPPRLWKTMVLPGSSIAMRARNVVLPEVDKKVSWLRKSIGKGST